MQVYEAQNFKMQVMNIFFTRHYDTSNVERIPLIKIGYEGRIAIHKDSD